MAAEVKPNEVVILKRRGYRLVEVGGASQTVDTQDCRSVLVAFLLKEERTRRRLDAATGIH